MASLIAELLKDRRGATAIEYGLIGALMSLAAIPAYHAIGGSLSSIFTATAGHMARAAAGM
jgi:pilus assembly protein Flp/PilA